jgi:hypothetical protein
VRALPSRHCSIRGTAVCGVASPSGADRLVYRRPCVPCFPSTVCSRGQRSDRDAAPEATKAAPAATGQWPHRSPGSRGTTTKRRGQRDAAAVNAPAPVTGGFAVVMLGDCVAPPTAIAPRNYSSAALFGHSSGGSRPDAHRHGLGPRLVRAGAFSSKVARQPEIYRRAIFADSVPRFHKLEAA